MALRIEQYELKERLGAGGMGQVYRARDVSLERDVALKFLNPVFASDPQRRQSLLQEAQAASALNHPNVCIIYEIGEARLTEELARVLECQANSHQTLHFIAMELVAGRSLSACIEKGPLDNRILLDHALQIADALHEAHQKGLIHRDIKGHNIMVTDRGTKILDFGLAKRIHRALEGEDLSLAKTAIELPEESTVGTPDYMSPEQARGLPLDARTDIFSLGVLLYEMATGHLPFKRDSVIDTLHAILHEPPPATYSFNRNLPAALERVVLRAIEKDPARRYQTMKELYLDLQQVRRSLDAGPAITVSPISCCLAVLPFATQSLQEDDAFLGEGLTEELIIGLSKLEALKVSARSTVMRFKNSERSPQEIGQELQVDSILTGSIRRSGKRVRISAQLVNVADGFSLWAEKFDSQMDDLFDIQDQVTRQIVRALELKWSRREQRAATRRLTGNPQAYEYYLKGRYFYGRRELESAINFYEKAIALDPDFAAALVELANAYNTQASYGWTRPAEAFAKSEPLLERALVLEPDLAEAYAAQGFVESMGRRNFEAGDALIEKSISLNPRYPDAYFFMASSKAMQSELVRATEYVARAQELEPMHPIFDAWAAIIHAFQGHLDEARACFKQALEIDPNFAVGHVAHAFILIKERKLDEALAAAERAVQVAPHIFLAHSVLGVVHALRGQRDRALQCVAKIESIAPFPELQGGEIASIFAALGDTEEALNRLEKALGQGGIVTHYQRFNPILSPLRSHPRYIEICRRNRLSP